MGAFDSEQQTETQEQQQQRIQAAVDATADRGMLPSRNGLYHFEIDHSGDAANTPAATTLASKVVDSVTESNVWKNLFQTDEQRLLEAQKFNDKYGIPTEVIVQGGNDAINKMREIDNTYETNKKLFGEYGKEFSLKNLYEYYPEMQNIVNQDANAAAIALKNIENVKATKGIFDAMVTGYNRMQDMMKRNDIGARMAQGEDSPELRSELDRLENNLREYRTTNGSEHPLEKVLGDTAAQGGMIAAQWWDGALKRAPQGMIMGSMAGAALGAPAMGVGALPGAVAGGITGFWTGANVGMAEEMYRVSIGGKYLENIRRTDKNGNRIMSDNEARGQAAAYALVDTAIEFVATRIMAKTVGAAMPNAALKEIFKTAAERATVSRGLMANVKRNATKAATISGTELAEEGLQDVNERLQDNFLAKYHPEIRRNTLGDVVEGAVNAMVEAVPSVVGLGALGAAGGNVRMVRDVINSGNGLRKVAIQQEVNAAGAQLLESLRQDQSSNQLMRKAPEVYAQVVQNQADRIGMGMMYVDAEIAMQSEEGTAALNKMVQTGVVSEKDLNEAITNGSTLEVPVGQYMQKVAPEVETSAIQEATAWTDGGINMGRLKFMQEHYKQIQARIEKEQTDRQSKAVNELMTEHFQDEATQGAALDVVSRNPFDLKRSHSQAVKEAREAYHLAVGMEGFKEGMGQGVSVIKNDDGSGVKTSNNAPWYSEFYKQNKRPPNAYELDRLAFAEFAKQVGTDTSPEAQAAIADVKSKLDHLDQLEAIKDQVKELAESDYMLRKTLSKEALSVYKDTQLTLLKGNKMVSEQAKAAAFLFAKHADVMAAYMQEAGSKDFTAADYAKQHGIQIGGELPAGAMKQPLNAGIDLTRTVDVVDLERAVKDSKFATPKELTEFLRELSTAGAKTTTADQKAIIDILSRDAAHIVRSGGPVYRALRPVRNASIKNITDLLKNAVLVESTPNAKVQEPDSRKQQRKNEVEVYHRFYVPVSAGGKLLTVRLVAEERNGSIQVDPKNVTLYDIIVEKQNSRPATATKAVDTVSDYSDGGDKATSKITIQQMLTGVNDTEGSPYFQHQRQQARGSMTVYDSGRQLMQLFQTANYSTFIHESGHMFLEDLRMLANMEEAPADIQKAWQTAQEWTGWKDGADNTAAHEKWATGFEAYIREGKAPSQELKSVFRQFKDWLLQVYQDLRQLGQVPPKEVQQIFDMMLATNAEIESYVAEQEVTAFNRKGFMGELSGSDEEIVKRWREDTLAEIKERVTAEFMKSYTAEAQKEKDEFLSRRRVELEKQLADSNEMYSVEALYKHFGDVVLKQRGMSIEQLQGELRRLGGTTEERLDEMMKQEERAVDSSIVSGENLRAWANEYLLSSEGQSKVIALEQTAMQRKANQVTAEVMKAMRILNENGDAKKVAAAMNELFGTKAGKEERLKSKLFGKSEKINELREKLNTLAENSSATIEEKDALISELKKEINKTMAGLRVVRDVVVGKREQMMEQAAEQLGSSKVAMATSFQHWQNKAIQVGREADRLMAKGDFQGAMQLKNEQMLFSCLAKVAHDNNQLVAKTIDTLKDKDRRISRTERPIMLGSNERYFYQHMLYQLGLRNEDGLVPDSGCGEKRKDDSNG